jgi:hypothetical protein
MMPVDFFARRSHYVDHLLPVWNALDESERGTFYQQVAGVPRGSNPMLVCGVSDLQVAHLADPKRRFIFMEHGVGITYGAHQAYAGGGGLRRKVDLFLAPNKIVREKTEQAIPGVKQVVIGTPKMDRFFTTKDTIEHKEKPIVCISFHWDGSRVQPEAGNAFEHFRKILPVLAQWRGFKLIGHGHPRAIDQFAKVYEHLGIEVERDFDQVMKRADVYVCDNSSTIYEFCVTGRPVVIMNSPHYRKHMHWGIRFWQYTDIGRMVDEPSELLVAILQALEYPEEWDEEREAMIADLYPFLGSAAARAAEAIHKYVSGAI